MIPKHILMNNTARSSIVRLAAYITDTQDKASRIERVSVRNCVSDDPQNAAREMEAVQLLNTRARADKTYHLLLSFPAGEEPTAEQLASIEDDFCAALGFTDHQRISVTHRDTDNLHVHLAINKIHPEKLTIHEPRRDFQILMKAAELIEKTYCLVKTNHTPTKTQSENRIDDAERMSGLETLATRIRSDCLAGLQTAQAWTEVHAICEKNGVTLQLRGNGLVFAQLSDDGTTLAVKASTVSRDLSKARLEARLGAYQEPAPERSVRNVEAAAVQANNSQANAVREPSVLWRQYRQALQDWQQQNAAEQARLKTEQAHKRKLIDELYKTERSLARSSLPYWQRRKRMQDLRKEFAIRRKVFVKTHRVSGYLEWLQQQAAGGDREALAALRRRAFALAKKGNAFLANNTEPCNDWPVDTVTKQGIVIYAVGKEVIRDRGESFHVSTVVQIETLTMAMQMAAKRSGNVLTLSGDEAFRNRCLEASVSCKLNIRFADPELEAKRRGKESSLIQQLKVPYAEKEYAKALSAKNELDAGSVRPVAHLPRCM